MSKTSKDRVANFTEEQKLYIVECIEERIGIIEDKKCDSNALKAKSGAWGGIRLSFNARYGILVETEKLKALWKRLKLMAKKEFRTYEKDLKKTGGGPPPADVSAITHKIISMIPKEFEQLRNPYDDDADAVEETGQVEDDESLTVIADDELCQPSTSKSTSSSSLQELSGRQDETTPFIRKRRRDVNHQSAKLDTTEETLVSLAKEEHAIKLKYMREEHELRMEVLQLKKRVAEGKLASNQTIVWDEGRSYSEL